MIAVLLFAQTDATGRKIAWIVFALVAVAAALALLTAWYWRVTDPAKRATSATDDGGRRRRDRDPDPEPSTPTPSQARTGPVIPGSTDPSVGPDATRVLDRSEILEQKTAAAPPVIDLRVDSTESEPQPDSSELLDVDLVERETDARAEVDDVAGAHDSGMDFDDWLALAEEDS